MGGTERGQAIVELSLALTVLLILGLGLIDAGRVLSAYVTVTNASREGARVAALGYADTQIQIAVSHSLTVLTASGVETVISPASSERQRGEPVTVEVRVPVEILFPGYGSFATNPVTVTARTVMRME